MTKLFKEISKLTSSDYFEFLSYLRLDVYFALLMFGFMLPGVPFSQFIQDKYCINQLKLEPVICLNLEKMIDTKYETIKNDVYTFSTTFRNYQHLITNPPGVILSIFMGYWIDTYPTHLKYLLALPCFGGLISELITIYTVINFESNVYNILWGSIPYAFTGGFFIVMTGSYTYITRRTRAKYRAARFAIFELFMFASMPLATALGGRILILKPWLIVQHRNYLAVFMIAFICKLIAMIWVLLLLNDADKPLEDPDIIKLDCDKLERINTANSEIIQDKTTSVAKSIDDQDNSVNDAMRNVDYLVDDKMMIELEPLKLENDEMKMESGSGVKKDIPTGCLPIIFDIFNPSTVSTMIRVCCRKRPRNARAILWNLMLAMNLMMIGHMGEATIGFPFSQKVYRWDAAYYAYISSITMLIPTLINTLLPIVLIHKFHLADTTLSIIGSVSLILSLTIKGGILESYAFFISVVVGICGGLLPIAIRSIISRIIDQSEAGQVYALLACIESSGPMVASVVYSAIFNFTIEKFPGIVHHFAAFTMFYPFLVSLWLDWTREKWDPTISKTLHEGDDEKLENDTIKKNELNQVDTV